MMNATELAEYQRMSEADKRAMRRKIAEEISRRDELDRRPPMQVATCSAESVLLGARADIEAFARGADDLMGMPRQCVDVDRSLDSIDRALAAAQERAEYSAGIFR